MEYTTTSLTGPKASNDEGVIHFDYAGVTVIFIWFKDKESTLSDIINDNYNTLSVSQPSLALSPISQGSVTVDTVSGKYLTFVTKSGSGENKGGGIIGSWRCSSENAFSILVSGSDATVVQIRFKRLVDNLECSK